MNLKFLIILGIAFTFKSFADDSCSIKDRKSELFGAIQLPIDFKVTMFGEYNPEKVDSTQYYAISDKNGKDLKILYCKNETLPEPRTAVYQKTVIRFSQKSGDSLSYEKLDYKKIRNDFFNNLRDGHIAALHQKAKDGIYSADFQVSLKDNSGKIVSSMTQINNISANKKVLLETKDEVQVNAH